MAKEEEIKAAEAEATAAEAEAATEAVEAEATEAAPAEETYAKAGKKSKKHVEAVKAEEERPSKAIGAPMFSVPVQAGKHHTPAYWTKCS